MKNFLIQINKMSFILKKSGSGYITTSKSQLPLLMFIGKPVYNTAATSIWTSCAKDCKLR